MDSEDARNVDEQLDEQQAKIAQQRQQPLVENHSNNARVETPPAGDPRSASESADNQNTTVRPAVAQTVSEPARGTEGTAIPGEEPGP